MIINAFKDKIFPLNLEADLFNDEDGHGDHEDEDGFYSHGELATIPKLPNSSNEEDTPRDMPDLKSEQKAKGLKY